mmetsp:Transcript_3099/g.5541  ORF Transcript_3099/g.5541 Transcript_3099/m.5541 type:complete len:386 (-) Transcript_3099:30-1187(-)
MDWDLDEDNDREDPNQLFSSPFKPEPESDDECDENESYLYGVEGNHSRVASSMTSMPLSESPTKCEMCEYLRLSKKSISDFWSSHRDRFMLFWNDMTSQSRGNFLRRVYPRIIEDFTDRYCLLDKVKQYRHDYDNILILSPYLNVVDLSYHHHLIQLLDKYAFCDDVLVSESAELVSKLRELHAVKLYPWSTKEREIYTKLLTKLKRGDSLLLCDPNTLDFGEVVIVENPRTVLLATGGETHQLYTNGHLMYPLEFQKVTENIAFLVTLLNDILSLFTTEVMNKDTAYLRKLTSMTINNVQINCNFVENAEDIMMTVGGGAKGVIHDGNTDADILYGSEKPSLVQNLIKSRLSKLSETSSPSSSQPISSSSSTVLFRSNKALIGK